MSLIGTLPASASAVFNLDFLPEYFLIDSSAAPNQSMSSFSVVTSGIQLMSITDSQRINALSKFDSGAILDAPGDPASNISQTASYLKLGVGRINKATTITATNVTAVAKNVFAASTNLNSVARRAVEQSINPSANATFDNFEGLFFLGANILRAQITYENGFTDEYTPTEIAALYSAYHVAEEGGTLGGLLCIDSDSGAGKISQVVLFNGSGGTTVVLKSDYVQL